MRKLGLGLLVLTALTCTPGFAQSQQHAAPSEHGTGNGGDYIRMRFIEIGKEILNKYAPRIEALTPVVSKKDLEKTLSIKVITTKEDQLFDNQNNPVDAIGEKGKIVLFRGKKSDETGWYGLLKTYGVVEKLVLHEMFRGAGVNDDDYAYTNKVITNPGRENSTPEFYIYWSAVTAQQIKVFKEDTSGLSADEELKRYNSLFKHLENYLLIDYFQKQGKTLKMINDLVQGGVELSNAEKVAILSEVLKTFDLQIKKLFKTLTPMKDESADPDEVRLTLFASAREMETESINLVFDRMLYKARNISSEDLSEIASSMTGPSLQGKRLTLEKLVKNLKK